MTFFREQLRKDSTVGFMFLFFHFVNLFLYFNSFIKRNLYKIFILASKLKGDESYIVLQKEIINNNSYLFGLKKSAKSMFFNRLFNQLTTFQIPFDSSCSEILNILYIRLPLSILSFYKYFHLKT